MPSAPAFTLERYVHMLADDPGEPLDLAAELARATRIVPPALAAAVRLKRARSALDADERRLAEVAHASLLGQRSHGDLVGAGLEALAADAQVPADALTSALVGAERTRPM